MKLNTKIISVDPNKLKLLEKNARFMKHEEFKKLVDNVRRDGKLTSVPFCCLGSDGKYEVLSGNHRVMAGIEAGLETIDVMVTDDDLSEQQKIAIQLSHNAIVGQDDPATLKDLYEKITDIDLKGYSGLDDKTLELLDSVNKISFSEAKLEFQVLNMIFLPDELERAKQVIDKAREEVRKDSETWLANYKDYDRWLDAVENASSSYGIKNVASAVDIVLSVFERHMSDLSEGWIEENSSFVPIESVIGRRKIPIQCARSLLKAVTKIRETGRAEDFVNALQIMSEDFLSGCEQCGEV